MTRRSDYDGVTDSSVSCSPAGAYAPPQRDRFTGDLQSIKRRDYALFAPFERSPWTSTICLWYLSSSLRADVGSASRLVGGRRGVASMSRSASSGRDDSKTIRRMRHLDALHRGPGRP